MTFESVASPIIVALAATAVNIIISRSTFGRIDALSVKMDRMEQKSDNSRELMIRDYATKDDLSLEMRDNKASHAAFWSEVNLIKERVVVIETKQDGCRTRAGKD